MKAHGLFTDVNDEVGQIIVADVDRERVAELLDPDGRAAHRADPEAAAAVGLAS